MVIDHFRRPGKELPIGRVCVFVSVFVSAQ